jgi:hypothetical protein
MLKQSAWGADKDIHVLNPILLKLDVLATN